MGPARKLLGTSGTCSAATTPWDMWEHWAPSSRAPMGPDTSVACVKQHPLLLAALAGAEGSDPPPAGAHLTDIPSPACQEPSPPSLPAQHAAIPNSRQNLCRQLLSRGAVSPRAPRLHRRRREELGTPPCPPSLRPLPLLPPCLRRGRLVCGARENKCRSGERIATGLGDEEDSAAASPQGESRSRSSGSAGSGCWHPWVRGLALAPSHRLQMGRIGGIPIIFSGPVACSEGCFSHPCPACR